jgi:hypothetical protein
MLSLSTKVITVILAPNTPMSFSQAQHIPKNQQLSSTSKAELRTLVPLYHPLASQEKIGRSFEL